MKSYKYQNIRLFVLFIVHIYIIFHFITWYVLDIKIWGKTAMMGIPSLLSGHINAAAIMVSLIFISVLFYGRAFCGWICHMRGAIEFADWLMRKVKVEKYNELRRKNILLNTRYRWLLRIGSIFVLSVPVIVLWWNSEANISIDFYSPRPMADLPGYNNLIFHENSPINISIAQNGLSAIDFIIAFGAIVLIQFFMSFVLNYFYGQGAFCRILCPYAVLLVPLMNINHRQKKITRIRQCIGCRDCSNSCPQGIDVSREIWNYEGKVKNVECIKCYNCIDSCKQMVLVDSSSKAVDQTIARKEYEKRPWLTEDKHLQVYEPIDPVIDFIIMILTLVSGGLASRLGGFWFYVGAIIGYIILRKIAIFFLYGVINKNKSMVRVR